MFTDEPAEAVHSSATERASNGRGVASVMTKIPIQLLIGLSLLAAGARAESPKPKPYEVREWTDHSGKFRVEAALIAFDGDRIRLRGKDGRMIVSPIARLSEADKSFLRRLALADETATSSWPLLFTGPGEGLRAEYYRDMSLDEIGLVRADGPLDFTYAQHQAPYQGGKPIKQISDGWRQHFAVRWSGLLVPRHTERYTLALEMDDGAALWLEDDLLIHNWTWNGNKEYTAQVDLVASRPHPCGSCITTVGSVAGSSSGGRARARPRS